MAFEDLSAEELQARLAQMENERVLLEVHWNNTTRPARGTWSWKSAT